MGRLSDNIITMINKISIAGVLAAIVVFGNQILPILPPAWANLVSALIGIYALYHTSKVVQAARSAGVKGI